MVWTENRTLFWRVTDAFITCGDYLGRCRSNPSVAAAPSVRRKKAIFEMDADSLLLLNNRQPYTMLLDAPQPVRTFCLFFRDGLVEDAWRSETSSAAQFPRRSLARSSEPGIFERMHPKQGRIAKLMTSMYGESADELLEDGFLQIARELLHFRSDLESASTRVPAARPSTKAELFRRLTRARSIIEASLDRTLPGSGDRRARIVSVALSSASSVQAGIWRNATSLCPVRRRMDRARRLLANSEMPVTEVCLETGFQSLGSFSTLFRRENGCSPQQYRGSSRQK